MKILHTADWHLGQVFYQFDRSFEHELFLQWLLETLRQEKIDALLVSGDVFDVSNPSAASIRLFYRFLNKAATSLPHLQIVVTAGNHDSGARLEAPRPLLDSSNIHIIGLVPRTEDGAIDYEQLIVPLKNKSGSTMMWCMAVPFLRMGDYPDLQGSANTYSDGVCAFYHHLYETTMLKKQPDQAVIAMGHLHAFNISMYDKESHDREIMGGVECIPLTAFNENISYIALGHIHRAQKVGNKQHIRYCGSPVPLSFSEIHYDHQVLLVDFTDLHSPVISTLEVPVSIPLLRVPQQPKPLNTVLKELRTLEDKNHRNMNRAPYLEVQVHLDGPEPSLRYQIESALLDKYVRLTRVVATYGKSDKNESDPSLKALATNLSPEIILKRIYQRKFDSEMPDDLLQLFNQVNYQVLQNET